MLLLISTFLFCSSPAENSLGPDSRSDSIPSQTCQECQTTEQWRQLFDTYLLKIVTEKEEYVNWFRQDLIAGFSETGYREDTRKFLVLNALLKRMRYFHPKSINFIDRERNRFSPNSTFEFGATGPTPEILIAAVNIYLPLGHESIYMNFLRENFPDSFSETDSDEENISGAEPHTEKKINIDPILTLEIRQWMEEIKEEKPQRSKKIRRAIHSKPWRY